MPVWDAYPSHARPISRVVVAPPSPSARLAGLGLGSRFDDHRWRDVLRARGWREAEVRGLPGFASPPLADGGLVLFCAPELGSGGLDDTPFLFGFRVPESDEDAVWKVVPHGDGELVFDRLAHAGAGFDRRAFLAWLSHESMADATRL